MIILTIRTDRPESEIGLYDNSEKLDYFKWLAHRQLAETINSEIESILAKSNKKYSDIDGIVVYRGPGSFTGLRIGISTANALSYGLGIPITGETGEDWISVGINHLGDRGYKNSILPEYGADVHITTPRK